MGLIGAVRDIKQQVVFALISNPELVSCLTDAEVNQEQSYNLVNKNIYKWFYIPEKPDTTRAYITMRCKFLEVSDHQQATVQLELGAFVHKQYMPYQGGARVDFMADFIHDTLQKYAFIEGNDYSVFQLAEMDHFYPQFQYDGYILTYIVSLLHFDKCKEFYGKH